MSSPVGTPCSEEISTAPPEEGGESHLWEKKEVPWQVGRLRGQSRSGDQFACFP